MRILVTGGSGFIGSHLVEKLISLKHTVCVFDNYQNFSENPFYYKKALSFRKRIFKNKPYKIFKEDIRKISKLNHAFKYFQPEIVIHLAGLPMARPPKKQAKKMIPINLMGSINVIKAYDKCLSSKRLIYISSSMAYGHFLEDFQKEDSILNPMNYYGATKAAGEYFVKLLNKDWVIVRPICIYGFTDCANRVTQLLVDAAYTGKSAWIVEGEKLDLTYVDDFVEGLIKCITSPKASKQTINISSGKAVSVKYFANLVKKQFPNFSFEIRKPPHDQVNRGGFNITRAKKILKFKPKYNIKKGLEKTLSLIKQYGWDKEVYKKRSKK